MFTTVRIYRNDKDLVDALVSRRNDVESVVRDVQGFRSYKLVRTTDGGAMSVTTTDDEASAQEINRVAAEFLRDNMGGATFGSPEVVSGTVELGFSSSSEPATV